jgi:hypothetical protein
MKRIIACIFLLVSPYLFFLSVAAQDPRGTIVGRVADPSGAVIPGVTVHARNTATKVSVQSVSNDVGLYQIIS